MLRDPILLLGLLAVGCAPAKGDLDPIDEEPTPDGDDDDDAVGDDDDDAVGDDDDDDAVGDDDDDGTPFEDADWRVTGQLTIPAGATPPPGDVTMLLFDATEDHCCAPWMQVDAGPLPSGQPLAFTFGMPDVLDEDEWFAPAADAPELEIAAFSVGAYIDEDGDGEPGPDDTYLAGELHTLLYLRGDLPDAYADAGLQLGWNEMQVDLSGPTAFTAISGDHSVPDVVANLLPVAPPSALTALIRPELSEGPAGTRRVEILSFNAVMTLPVAAPVLASVEVASPGLPDQVVTFPHPLPGPPDDHYTDTIDGEPLVDVEMAAYISYAYPDANEDGVWTFPAEPHLASFDGPAPEERTLLVHTRATGVQARWMAASFGHMGWLIVRPEVDDEADAVVPWTDGLLLE